MSAAPHVLPLGVQEAERERAILREHATAEARFLAETLPVVRVFRLTDRMVSASDEARRLAKKGYRVELHITANDAQLKVWSKGL